MLEVGDRLFSAFGQDTIDALLWTATEPRSKTQTQTSQHLGTLPHLLFAVAYVCILSKYWIQKIILYFYFELYLEKSLKI